MYHLHRIDSCGISVAQALEVLDEVTLWVILADQEPWGLATRARRAEKLKNIRMVEGLPYLDFAQEELAWCCFGKH